MAKKFFSIQTLRTLAGIFVKQTPTRAVNFGSSFGHEAPDMTEGERLQSYIGWVYTCVDAIAKGMRNMELELFKVDAKGDIKEETTSPVFDLLYKVNPYTTLGDLLELHSVNMDLAGESFWYLVSPSKTPGPKDKPVEIWMLRPDWMEVISDSKNFIKGYLYRPAGKEAVPFTPSEILHFKNANPTNTYRGYAPTQAGAYSIDTFKFSSIWNRNFFYNSARPDAVLETESELSDAIFERVRRQWETKYQGMSKAHSVGVLEGGLKYHVVSASPKDMDFKELRTMTRDEIMAIYRIPKTILGITDDVNRANAETAKAVFAEYVLKPRMQKTVDTLNEFLVPRFGEDLYLDFKDPVPANREAEINEYEKGHNRWLSTNDIRIREGMEPVDGGDVIYIPFTSMPMGESATGEAKTAVVELKTARVSSIKLQRKGERLKRAALAGRARLQRTIQLTKQIADRMERNKKKLTAEEKTDERVAELINENVLLLNEKTFLEEMSKTRETELKAIQEKAAGLEKELSDAKALVEDAIKVNEHDKKS